MRRPILGRPLEVKRDQGFSLVELMVAMLIIAGVLMTLIAVQISAAATVVEARKRTQATAYANEAMEQLRSLPWIYLERGLYAGFATASGGDPRLSGNILTVAGEPYTLRVAAAGTYTLPINPARVPLMASTGSNKTVKTDAAVTNTSFTIRAYVTEPERGEVNAVGLLVVVEWTGNNGLPAETTMYTTAYKGTGCGDETTAPFLASCQALFDGSASSGQVSTTVGANTIPDGINPVATVPLLYGTASPFYRLTTRSATAAASVQSQQVSNLTAMAQYGGAAKDDDDPDSEPTTSGWTSGYATKQLVATDDVTNTNVAKHVGTTSLQQAYDVEAGESVTWGGHNINFRTRSDYYRPATAMASSTASCKTGIPVGAPCALSNIANLNGGSSLEHGSGYLMMEVDGTLFRLVRRITESTPPTNSDEAWVARFASTGGTAAVGCTTLTGAGCVSAGASRSLARLSIGTVVSGGSWDAGAAPDGIVVVEGRSGCSSGLTETVFAQRGSNQKDTIPTATKCGQVRWWNGSSYATTSVTTLAVGQFSTVPVTWTGANYSVTAVATVSWTAPSNKVFGTDPTNCKVDACSVLASTGSMSIVVTYSITSAATNYQVVAVTTVDGPVVSAMYKEAPSA